jgi:hypothetical protein
MTLAELRSLAKAATPGPWHVHRQPTGFTPRSWWLESEAEVDIADIERDPDAAYIAAASPDVVLALIAVAEAARDVQRADGVVARGDIDSDSIWDDAMERQRSALADLEDIR